jgi:hypothetical protein
VPSSAISSRLAPSRSCWRRRSLAQRRRRSTESCAALEESAIVSVKGVPWNVPFTVAVVGTPSRTRPTTSTTSPRATEIATRGKTFSIPVPRSIVTFSATGLDA